MPDGDPSAGDARASGPRAGDRNDSGGRTTAPPDGVAVRRASASDHLGVMRVLDGANLELSAETAERRIDDGTVVVAADDGRVVGALVAVPHDQRADAGASRDHGAHVEAIAVRRRRRARGIGSALVAHAAREWTPLTVAFDARVKSFYESLGFDCERGGDRYRGVLDGA